MKAEQAKIKYQQNIDEKCSPEVQDRHLSQLFMDLSYKERRHEENRNQTIFRLNSAVRIFELNEKQNKIKEVKVK